MGWGIKRELSLTDCVQNTYCALNAAYRLRAGYKTLVKLHMCYHPKMAGIGGKGCNCFTYWFFFSRRVLIVKWLTGCYYLHGEAMDNFWLHMFENSPLYCFIFLATSCGIIIQSILSLNLYRYTWCHYGQFWGRRYKWSFTFSSDERFYNRDNECHCCVCVRGKERNVVLISLNVQQIVHIPVSTLYIGLKSCSFKFPQV